VNYTYATISHDHFTEDAIPRKIKRSTTKTW